MLLSIRFMASILLILLLGVKFCLTQHTENRDVVEGQSIRLQCRFPATVASSNTFYYWIRTDEDRSTNAAIKDVVLDSQYHVDFVPQEGRYDLVISRAQYNKDNRKFSCNVQEGGSGNDIYSITYIITVLIPPGPPQITPPKPVAREGDAFALSCMSEGGSPDPIIQWYREDAPLQAQLQKGGSRERPTTSVLTINPRMEDDNATYRCAVWNRAIREEMKMEATVVLRVHYAPRITVGPYNPQKVVANSDAVLTCFISANPPVRSVRWMKSGQLLSHTLNHTIPAVKPEDSGIYTCVAENGIGDPTQVNLELAVIYGPVVKLLPEKEVSLGESLAVKCNIASYPPPHTIEWYKEDDPFFRQNGDTLRLENVASDDSGKYTCKATSTARPSGSSMQRELSNNASVVIHVRHKPGEAVIQPSTLEAISGKPLTMICTAKPPGYPVPEYRWWKEGQEKIELSRNANFTLISAHVSHEGRYYCQPQNSLGHGTIASSYLTVYEPVTITIHLQPQVVKKESDINFSITCRAKGKPKPQVQWLHDGQDISKQNGFFKIVTTSIIEDNNVNSVQSTLTFDGSERKGGKLAAADRGKYSCVYDNGFGETSSDMTLKIEHSPIVKHTYNRVAFDPRENAVLKCIMQAYPEPVFEWFHYGRVLDNYGTYRTNITEISGDTYVGVLSIKDITEDDYGEYTCRAWNQVGGDKKTIIKLVKKGVPEKPTGVEVVDVSSDSVTLRWTEGFNGGFASTEYLVTYMPIGSTKGRNESCRAQNICHIIGLQSETEYKVKVLAVNPRGYSEYSEEVVVKTKPSLRDMPRALEAHFDKETNKLTFSIEPIPIPLLAKIQARYSDDDEWISQNFIEVKRPDELVHLKPGLQGFSDVRVILCLQSNESWCGDAKLASPFDDVSRTAEAGTLVSVDNLVLIIAISGSIFFLLLGMVICCCWCKRGQKGKKKQEIKALNVGPQPVTLPYYSEENLTKNADVLDSPHKPNIYITGIPDNPNDHMCPNTPDHGLLYPSERDLGPCLGPDSHINMMIKAGEIPPDGSYYPFDGDMTNDYYHAGDFKPVNEDIMNMKNREHLHSPYYDVSGLPDPYSVRDEDKMHNSMCFDESLESGYSTPNSRSRRVIREIIV